MLNFKKPTIEDREWVRSCVEASGYMGCEFSFANIIIWSSTYNTEIAHFGDFLIARGGSENDVRYFLPAGKGSLKEPVEEIIKDAEKNGARPIIFGITPPHIEMLNEMFPGQFSFAESRDSFDYVYLKEKLAALPGKKYHAKRNHIAKFEKSCDWEFVPIDKSNIDDCYTLHRKWKEMDRNKYRTDLGHEVCALNLALENFFEMELFGGILKANGEPIAFTIADKITDKTVDVHFEKALDTVNGAYAAINQQLCKSMDDGVIYVNREEDLGIEGLRKAKLSYHPYMLLQKHAAIMK